MRKALLLVTLPTHFCCRTANILKWSSLRRSLKTTRTSWKCWRKEKTNKMSKSTNLQKTKMTMELKSTCNRTTEN